MDETERAMLAEANAAANGAARPAPAPAAADDDVMEIEAEPEPEQIRIVRDYKRADPRCAASTLLCSIVTGFFFSCNA